MIDAFGREGKRPTVGCDAVIFSLIDERMCVLLIQRGNEPFIGNWAFPGGFMEWGESCEETVARELEEETGLKDIDLKQFGVFSRPGRDPRGTVVSVAFMAFVDHLKFQPKAGDDASNVRWWPVDAHPQLAFDHETVLSKALSLVS